MKNNQQGRQSKSPFKAFLGINYYSKYQDIVFVSQPWWLTFFHGFFARRHEISNLNPEIGHSYEIIIAFGEDSTDQNIFTGA